MKCPYCLSIIEDDSRYCDQCGTMLMFCPSCGVPKKGSSCPRCGEVLIPGAQFFSSNNVAPAPKPAPAPAPKPTPTPTPAPASAVDSAFSSALNSVNSTLWLEGEGMRLEIKEGEFGRKTGMYPEFGRIPTISGRHGRIEKSGLYGWNIYDLGSTNGTFINGQRLEAGKAYELKTGMLVKIATLKFIVK